jgi:rod shape-determining protein MreC
MIYLERDTKLQEGDLIKTSGTGGLFPQGYLIGSVDHLELMDSGLSKYAVLNPAVNFDALTSVMVILDYDGKGAETIPEDQTAVQTTVTTETTTLAETTTETTTTVTVLTTETEAANGQN